MAATHAIVIVKRFTWKGQPEEWSNKYTFTGGAPADNTKWLTLCRTVSDSEITFLDSRHFVATYYGYVAGNDHSVFQYDFDALGTPKPNGLLGADGSGRLTQGDAAGWVRALVGQSSKGKNVYVRKYFHGLRVETGNPDQVATVDVPKIGAHADLLLSGNLPGGSKWVSPTGATPISPYVGRYITTRTLKRRGKRPS